MACGQSRSGWTFHRDQLASADVVDLLNFHFEEMRRASPADACHVLALSQLRSAEIEFWSIRKGGSLLGVGALKTLDRGHGEIKSMRTAPAALGRGVGSAMLRHLIDQARRKEMHRISLETGGSDVYAAAITIYERAGFVPCGPFGGYRPTPFTRFFTLTL